MRKEMTPADRELEEQWDLELWQAAREGDAECHRELWSRMRPIAADRAQKTAKKYRWLDPDDIEQFLATKFPRLVEIYEPSHGKPFSMFVHFSFAYRAKDFCRFQDPVGICWPQKKEHPPWSTLSAVCENAGVALDTLSWTRTCDVGRDDSEPDPLDEVVSELRDWHRFFFGDAAKNRVARKKMRPKTLPVMGRVGARKRRRPWSKSWRGSQRNRGGTLVAYLADLNTFKHRKKRKMSESPELSPEELERKRRSEAGKKAAETRRANEAKQGKAVSPTQLVKMAVAFADAAGGVKKAAELLDALSHVRK